MNCPNCGTSNLDNSAICVNCGRSLAPGAAQAYTPPPPPPSYGAPVAAGAQVPNYLVQAILVTLCCCLPLGVVAIVFAAQVNTKLAQGDMAGALEASQKAKMFSWIAFGLGLAGTLVWLLFFGLGAVQGIMQGAGS